MSRHRKGGQRKRLVGAARRRATSAPDLRPVRMFAIRFLVLLLVLQGMTFLPGVDGVVQFLVTAYAHMAGWALAGVSNGVVVEGATLRCGEAAILTVESGCSGKEYFVVWSAAVLAFPCHWGVRLAGLGAGFLALCALNTLRVASLFWVGMTSPGLFHALHEDWWSMGLTLATVGLLAAWLSIASSWRFEHEA